MFHGHDLALLCFDSKRAGGYLYVSPLVRDTDAMRCTQACQLDESPPFNMEWNNSKSKKLIKDSSALEMLIEIQGNYRYSVLVVDYNMKITELVS